MVTGIEIGITCILGSVLSVVFIASSLSGDAKNPDCTQSLVLMCAGTGDEKKRAVEKVLSTSDSTSLLRRRRPEKDSEERTDDDAKQQKQQSLCTSTTGTTSPASVGTTDLQSVKEELAAPTDAEDDDKGPIVR